jgi:hypothetical protein
MRRNLPEGVDADAILEAMPWLADWLVPASEQAHAAAVPRDFIRTPFALTMLDIKPRDARFLDGVTEPWVALQGLVRVFLGQHVSWIGAHAPLHGFVISDQMDECLAAAQALGSSIHPIGPHGHTALTLAAMLGRNAAVEMLLAHGADLHATDILGNTALHWACIMRNRSLIHRLCALGANQEQLNLLGGRPADYDEAWNRVPPAQIDMQLHHHDGTVQHVRDQDAFKRVMQFELLPLARPGIDFYVQLVLGMLQPPWVENAVHELNAVGSFERRTFTELPLFLKDFGEPFGWGVCTHEAIPEGTPVTGYVGDLVHTFEVTVDLFNCGFTLYTSNAQPSEALQSLFLSHFDARRSGNLGSRINSAHVPEAASLGYLCRYWCGLPTAMFFAARDIEAGEQISWFYGDGYWRARGMPAQPLPLF